MEDRKCSHPDLERPDCKLSGPLEEASRPSGEPVWAVYGPRGQGWPFPSAREASPRPLAYRLVAQEADPAHVEQEEGHTCRCGFTVQPYKRLRDEWVEHYGLPHPLTGP